MTYEDVLNELDKIGIKEKFIDEFEAYCPDGWLLRLKEIDSTNSPGNVVRLLLAKYEVDSENWTYWRKVLMYFITPEFARVKDF